MLYQKLFVPFLLHNRLSIFSSFLSLPAFHHFFLSLPLPTIAHSLTIDLLVLMKYVCSKIIYFVFASFFEVKNAFRNLEIKNLVLFGEFFDDFPINHQNFDTNSIQFDGHQIPIELISMGILRPSKFRWEFDGISMVIEFLSKFR